jgi:hypothetical protein
MGEQHGVWAERAWAFKYLYSQSFVVTTFAGMAGSPLFGELKNRQKRFVRGTLEKRSELLISTGVNLREELSDGFTKDLAARALQIGKHGLRAVSEEPTNPVMGLDHPGEDVFSIDNSKVSLSAEKIDITEMRRRINASITQIDKDKRFVDTLGLESGSLPRVVTDEWRRDAQKILAALGK